MSRHPPGPADEPDQLALRRCPGALLEGRAADEVAGLVELDHPAKAGVERGEAGSELVAVERHPGLEPERVPCGQAGRYQPVTGAGLGQCRPDRLGVLAPGEQLEAVLARVARPRQQDFPAGDGRRVAGVILHRTQISVGQRSEDLRRVRALKGDQRILVGPVRDLGTRAGPVGQRLDDDIGVGGVGDDKELAVGKPVDDQVVEDSAVRGADHRVPGAAGCQRGGLADQRVVQGRRGAGPGDHDLAHVREVEEPGRRAHRVVLRRLAAVTQRHQPPGEPGQRRAETLVHAGQRRAARRRMRVCHLRSMAG